MVGITQYTSQLFVRNFNKNDLVHAIKQQPDNAVIPPKPYQSMLVDASIDDSDILDADLGTYHAFSSVMSAPSGDGNQTKVISDAALAIRSSQDHQASNVQVWKDLFSIIRYFHLQVPDANFDDVFYGITDLSFTWSYLFENMEGQHEFTDELKQEFLAEVERYAPDVAGETIDFDLDNDFFLAYTTMRISGIMQQSAPESVRDMVPPSATLPIDFTFHKMDQMVFTAFEDTMATGHFFNMADTPLWKALDILVTPIETGLSQDGFYNYLKANARSIYAGIKSQTSTASGAPYRIFGILKAIIDTARAQYQAASPVAQMFSEKGPYSL